MATTSYSYNQILPGFSGYFDVTSDATHRCMQANSCLLLAVTGTSATMRYGGGGSQPFYCTVDGVETKPTLSGGSVTLFTGLADTVHIVNIEPSGTTFPTYNWFLTTEANAITVTGAAPAMTPIPMHFATWPDFPGLSTLWTTAAPGGNITPTHRQVFNDNSAVGTMSFVAQCDTIYVLSGNGPLKYSVDGGTIQNVTPAAALTERRAQLLATGLDATQPHTYTVWMGDNGAHPQAVACLANGSPVTITAPTGLQTMFLYGASTVYGAGGTRGGVDIFQVGLNLDLAVAKYGISGLTINGLTTNVPTYFTRSAVPEHVLLGIGRNNIGSGTFQADYTACIQAFINQGCTKIICRGLWPEGSDTWPTENAAMAAAVASFANPDIVYLPTTTWTGIATADGLHPTDAGYVTIAGYETTDLGPLVETYYSLTIDANGSTSGAAPDVSSHPAGAITLPTNTGNLSKTNYTLTGWNTLANGSGTHYALGGAYTMPENNVTLYAEWTINAPGNTTAPSVSGPALGGQEITGNAGVWTNSPTAYAYQWQRYKYEWEGNTWENITDATMINYTPTQVDNGAVLRLEVTATNAGGSTSQASAQTSTIATGGTGGGEHSYGFFG